jgi:hypothetical protein
VLVEGHSVSLEQGFGTQWPEEHASCGAHSLGPLQAGMHEPLLPPAGQTHGPPGPHTIGLGGAASLISVQSESTLHGFSGRAQIPHPMVTPPGLHDKKPCAPRQSLSVLQRIAPSGRRSAPPSAGHAMFDCWTVHTPPLHVAVTLHPYVHVRPLGEHAPSELGFDAGHPGGFPLSVPPPPSPPPSIKPPPSLPPHATTIAEPQKNIAPRASARMPGLSATAIPPATPRG